LSWSANGGGAHLGRQILFKVVLPAAVRRILTGWPPYGPVNLMHRGAFSPRLLPDRRLGHLLVDGQALTFHAVDHFSFVDPDFACWD